MGLSLLSEFDRHAEFEGSRPFVHFVSKGETTTCSYAEMKAQALKAAALFAEVGVTPGSVVFIVLRHQIELYSTFLGAMYAGLTPSFLPFPTPKQDPDLYWSSHRELFQRVEPAAVLTYGENMAPLRTALDHLNTHVLDVNDLASRTPLVPGSLPGLQDVALLQHSSGTTGLKKGVMLTYGEIAAQVRGYSASMGYCADDIVVSWLPLYHDMGLLSSFLIPTALGATIVSMDAFEWVGRPDMLLDLIQAHRGTLTWMPNFAFNHIARLRRPEKAYDLSSMRAFIACSEPCKPETFGTFTTAFADAGVKPESLQACYAMAETVFAVSQSPLGRPAKVYTIAGAELDEAGSVRAVQPGERGARGFIGNGAPIPGLEVVIDGPDGRMSWSLEATSLFSGDIVVRGDCVFSGYYRNPEATAAALADGWYTTGDVGFFADGELFICGRRKELMIVHGKNYYATDVEEAINVVEGVKPGRAVAFALYSDRTQSEEGYVVVESDLPREDWTVLKRKIKEAVFSRLELTLQTVVIVEPGWLVKTTSGKISRKENAKKYIESMSARILASAEGAG